MNNKSKF